MLAIRYVKPWPTVTRAEKDTAKMTDDDFNYDEYSDDVDLDPANKPATNRVERFKGETKKIYRAALMYFHPLPVTIYRAFAKKAKREESQIDMAAVRDLTAKALAKVAEELGKPVDALEEWEKLDLRHAQFKTYSSYYHEDVGSVVSRFGKDGPEADRVWKTLGEARPYWSSVALFYPLDSHGNVDAKNIARDAFLKPWRIGKHTFKTLIEKNQMLQEYKQSLANSDLRLECKSAQYQTFDIDPAGGALWLKSPALKQKFLPLAYAMYDKLVDAREMSTADLRKKLAEAGADVGETSSSGQGSSGRGAPGRNDVAADDEIEDLLENV